ncbi:hypothetical protein L873DRAFT_1800845, partial [Choiromyces venosus 120613-1]
MTAVSAAPVAQEATPTFTGTFTGPAPTGTFIHPSGAPTGAPPRTLLPQDQFQLVHLLACPPQPPRISENFQSEVLIYTPDILILIKLSMLMHSNTSGSRVDWA